MPMTGGPPTFRFLISRAGYASMADAARKCGVNYHELWRVSRGYRPTVEQRQIICEALRCTDEELLEAIKHDPVRVEPEGQGEGAA